MRISEKSRYKDICDFLTNKSDVIPFEDHLHREPGYGIFAEIKLISGSLNGTNYKDYITYAEAEEFLEHYLAGTLSAKEAQFLKKAILGSEKAFVKIIKKIEMQISAISEAEKNKSTGLSIEAKQSSKLVTANKKHIVNDSAIISSILAIAAIFLILFILPIQFQQNLDDLYNFDSNAPLDYQTLNLRGAASSTTNGDPDYKLFQQQFKVGMSNYLAQEYSSAISEWQKIEEKLPILRKKPGFVETDEKQLKLYSALSFLGMALSKNSELSEQEKKQSLLDALNQFKEMTWQNDTTKYYFALTLALNNRVDKAQDLLNDINSKSTMHRKKVVLEERLNQ